MWFIIPLGAIIGGPIGFFIALAIWFFLQSQDKTDHHTSQHTPAAAASSSPTARNLTINELMPTIRLVCFFLTQKKGWNACKLEFMNQHFARYCQNDLDEKMLHGLIHQGNAPLQQLLARYSATQPHQDNRNLLYALCAEAMLIDHDGHQPFMLADLETLSRSLQVSAPLYEKIRASFVEHIEAQGQACVGQLEHAKKVLGLSGVLTPKAINDLYRRKAADFHPDRTPHATDAAKALLHEKFIEISAARDLLLEHLRRQG